MYRECRLSHRSAKADIGAVYEAYEEVFDRKEPKGRVINLLQVHLGGFSGVLGGTLKEPSLAKFAFITFCAYGPTSP